MNQPKKYDWLQIPFTAIVTILTLAWCAMFLISIYWLPFLFEIISLGLAIGAVAHRKNMNTKRRIATTNIVFLSIGLFFQIIIFLVSMLFVGMNIPGIVLLIVGIISFACGIAGAVNSRQIANYNLDNKDEISNSKDAYFSTDTNNVEVAPMNDEQWGVQEAELNGFSEEL